MKKKHDREAKKRKDRIETEKVLLETVGFIMETEGVPGLYINNVWRRSGVAKTALYRYFKSFDGLVLAYYRSLNFILEDLIFNIQNMTKDQLIDMIMAAIEKTYNLIAQKKAIRRFMLWEVTERNELFIDMVKEREAAHVAFLNKIKPLLPDNGINFIAVYSTIYSAINAMLIRSKTYPGTRYGLYIGNADGRKELFSTFRQLLVFSLA